MTEVWDNYLEDMRKSRGGMTDHAKAEVRSGMLTYHIPGEGMINCTCIGEHYAAKIVAAFNRPQASGDLVERMDKAIAKSLDLMEGGGSGWVDPMALVATADLEKLVALARPRPPQPDTVTITNTLRWQAVLEAAEEGDAFQCYQLAKAALAAIEITVSLQKRL